ncbi:MAG TPA: hypothetical protein VN397_02765 [Candidatus Methylomirabilis sp.]|nr:hypothetical protein [Candidatus Methylomirabilis sp.]
MNEDRERKKSSDEITGGWTSDLPPPRHVRTDAKLPGDCQTDDVKAEEARLDRAYLSGFPSSPISSSKPPQAG